jgi:methyl-accepting chemotaxis protein
MDKASIAALQIDAEKHSLLKNQEQENSLEYQNIKKTLQQIRDSVSDIHYIYTMREDEKGNIIFIVDAEENPEEISHLGEKYFDASPLLKKNFNRLNTAMVEDDFYTDRWGTWLSGYAPFYDKNGKREGVLGVDIKAEKIKTLQKDFLITYLLLFLLIGIISVLFSLFLLNNLIKPLLALTQEVKKFKQGKGFDISAEGNDEIAVLTRELGDLTQEITNSKQNMEETVKRRVDDLEKQMGLMVGRELKMVELKNRIKELETKTKKAKA